MNEHLSPIFETILPTIEKVGIAYWVYGGIAIAGIKGEFVRKNRDVDIFVLENNYQDVIEIVGNISKNLSWKCRDTELNNKRPKREFFNNKSKSDIFSIVPVYKVADKVIFKFSSEKSYSEKILVQNRRKLGNYIFFTPNTEFVKELFIHNLEYLTRSKKLQREEIREKYKIDAKVILSQEEYNKYF